MHDRRSSEVNANIALDGLPHDGRRAHTARLHREDGQRMALQSARDRATSTRPALASANQPIKRAARKGTDGNSIDGSILTQIYGTEKEGDWAIVLAFALLPIIALIQAVVL